MDKEELNLDSKLLLPIKQSLEKVINRLMFEVINKDKEAEINLKISIDKIKQEKVDKNFLIIDKWTEPIINYQITEKIKAYKETSKGNVGHNFKIDQENDKFIVEEVNKQTSFFDKENEDLEMEEE